MEREAGPEPATPYLEGATVAKLPPPYLLNLKTRGEQLFALLIRRLFSFYLPATWLIGLAILA
jgi:hypothetical protein